MKIQPENLKRILHSEQESEPATASQSTHSAHLDVPNDLRAILQDLVSYPVLSSQAIPHTNRGLVMLAGGQP